MIYHDDYVYYTITYYLYAPLLLHRKFPLRCSVVSELHIYIKCDHFSSDDTLGIFRSYPQMIFVKKNASGNEPQLNNGNTRSLGIRFDFCDDSSSYIR